MFTLKAKILGLLIILLVLGGCVPDTAVPVTVPPTRTMVMTETGTAVAQTPPTITPTVSPTPTHAQTSAAQPASTHRPTPTSFLTPTPVVYDLPAWVLDPEVNVLVLGSYGDDGTITLFNAETGEQFEIYMGIDDLKPAWIWQDGRYFLSPTSPTATQEVIDIQTGNLVKLAPINQDSVSPNGRYAAHITNGDRFDVVTLVDQETGLETELTNPFQDSSRDDYVVGAEVHWSPDGALLAVLYKKHYYDDNSDHSLVIYAPSGELFRQYENMSISRNSPWSPVLPHRILYTDDNKSFLPKMPCILDVVENEQTCLEIVGEWVESQNVWPYNFVWSPDGSKISFVHVAREERVNKSGACYIELATEEIFCPITPDDLQLEEQFESRGHYWSPDGRYLALFSDRSGPLSDVFGDFAVTTVSRDGQNLQILGLGFSSSHYNPWRPSIPTPSEE